MSTPKCNEFESRLQEAVERREPWLADGRFRANGRAAGLGALPSNTIFGDALVRHAVECETCQQIWQSELLVDRAIAEWCEQLPEVDLVERILAGQSEGLTTDPPALRRSNRRENVESRSSGTSPVKALSVIEVGAAPESRAHRRALNGMVALVSGCLIAALVIWVASAPPFGNRGTHLAGRLPFPARTAAEVVPHQTAVARFPQAVDIEAPAEAELPAAADSPRVEVSELIRDVGTAYLSLAGNAAASVRSAASLVPAEGFSLLTPSSSSVPVNSVPPTDNADPDAQEGPPWKRNIGRALDFLLWDSMAPEESPAT